MVSVISFFILAFIFNRGIFAKDPVHILYLTDCTRYSDWQAVGMDFSFRNSGQKGHITRVMCCTDEEKAAYNHGMLELMPSHVAPSFAYNEKTKDHYAAFNKPGAVLDFMRKGQPLADYMLVIDSDMQLRHPFRPDKYNMSRGKAISADYTYMIGCSNDLAVRHIPEIAVRNDTLAGPWNRRCDMVGGYTFMHRDDLAAVAPLWLSITVDVREDPESWRLSGDQYVEKGGKAWISEMYGYSFACAKSGVWHTWDTKVMHYPTYEPAGIPKLMHYGLEFKVGDFQFDKHWQYELDVTICAPWDLSQVKSRKGGIFQHPPAPSTLNNQRNYRQHYRDLLAIETVATLNAGLCDYHLKHCPPHQQIVDECKTALSIYKEVKAEIAKVEASFDCNDFNVKCSIWTSSGECESNKEYMEETCRKSCKKCGPVSKQQGLHPPEQILGPATVEYMKNLVEMERKLKDNEATDPDTKASSSPPIIPQNTAAPKDDSIVTTQKQEGGDSLDPDANPKVEDTSGTKAGSEEKLKVHKSDKSNDEALSSPPIIPQNTATTQDDSAVTKQQQEGGTSLDPDATAKGGDASDTKMEAEVKLKAEHSEKQNEEVMDQEVEAEKAKAIKVKAEQDAKIKEEIMKEEAKRRGLAQARAEILKSNKISASGRNSNAQLVVRCQRMPLTLEEVKECIKKAQKGVEFQKEWKSSVPEIKNELRVEDQAVLIPVIANVVDDESSPVVSAKLSTTHNDPHQSTKPMWKALFLWLLVVGFFLMVLSFQFKRRSKPDRRSE